MGVAVLGPFLVIMWQPNGVGTQTTLSKPLNTVSYILGGKEGPSKNA